MTTTTMPTPSETPTNRLVRKIRMRALLFFVLALIAGAGAVFLVKSYMDKTRAASAAQPVMAREVVVAAVDIPIGTELEQRHIAIVRWPTDSVPGGTFSAAAQVVGRSVEQSLVAGEPILAARLAQAERGRGLAAILKEGHRAMAVKVDQVIGIAGFVQPGDYVDVITTMKPDDDTKAALASKAASIAKIVLQNIRVLAIGPQLSTEGTKPITVPVVTLEVTPAQAEMLALASQYGKIQLTMRSRVDQATVETEGASPLTLLAADEAARPAAPASPAPVAEAKAPEPHKRAHRSRRERASASRPRAEAKPVVEILRGTTKVEERTLRPSADAK